jgi:hypothetical protein
MAERILVSFFSVLLYCARSGTRARFKNMNFGLTGANRSTL